MTDPATIGKPRIAVAIPCYNEAAAVAVVVGQWRDALPGAEIVVFDNNSTDGTGAIARGLGVTVVDVPKRGKGYAVRAIFSALGDRDAVVMVDGDGTYTADHVGPLLGPVLAGRADMAVGARRPVAEAGAVLERLTGLPLPRATLDRLARRQGNRAEQKRAQLDAAMRTGAGAAQQGPAPPGPITTIIEIDAWNIRERDDWGQAETLRQQGCGPEHWHWVYGGTCFSLSQRAQTEGGRAVILSRGYVMTRGGLEALREQIHAEALRHHLGRAERVLVIGDGALWIWNLAADRFPQAAQRLDYYHASQQLWAVARALHPEAEAAARTWIEPLLKKLKAGRGLRVIEDLRGVVKRVRQAKRRAVETGLNYLESHQ